MVHSATDLILTVMIGSFQFANFNFIRRGYCH